MAITFGNVRPGIALSSAEADKLRGEIYAVLSGMGTMSKGSYCTVPNFKLSDGRKIPMTATVTAANGNDLTVDLS